MFINFWYAAEESKNLTDEPMHVRLLSQDFVFFRDSSEKAHCLSNVCCHRGASLAHGKIKAIVSSVHITAGSMMVKASANGFLQ